MNAQRNEQGTSVVTASSTEARMFVVWLMATLAHAESRCAGEFTAHEWDG